MTTETIDDAFNLDDGVDGLDQDLSRIKDGRDLDQTIDLSEIKINRIELDGVSVSDGRKDRHSVAGLSRVKR
ncbi:hypothetical protein ACODHD_11640 [Vagococcus fluvialis]